MDKMDNNNFKETKSNTKYSIKNVSQFLTLIFVHLFYFSIFPITIYIFTSTLKSQNEEIFVGVATLFGFIISFFLFLLELSLSSKYGKYSYLMPKYIRIINYLFTIPIFIIGFFTPSLLYYFKVDVLNYFLIFDILFGAIIIYICLNNFIRGLKSIIKDGEWDEINYSDSKSILNFLIEDKEYIECRKRFTIGFIANTFLFILLENLHNLPWLVIIISSIFGIFSVIYLSFLFKIRYRDKYLKYLFISGLIYITGIIFLSLTLYDIIVIPLMDKNDIVIIPSLTASFFILPFRKIFLARNQQTLKQKKSNSD
jgi:hypothetical protein